MAYTIMQVVEERVPFGRYNYRIFRDGSLVANYWHDYRGDDHGIEFLDGRTEMWPVGRMTDFVDDSGTQPSGLSGRAVEYLDSRLGTGKPDGEA